MQKIVKFQVTKFLEENKVINKKQYGFRNRSNTVSAVFDLVSVIQNKCDNKKIVCVVFIDISKAFDSCQKNILLRSLFNVGIRGKSLDWFKDFLSERKQYISVDNITSTIMCIDYGVVQGSIIGPLLFNCYINDIEDLELNSELFEFADDMAFVCSADSVEVLQNMINEDMKLLENWMNQHKLSVNTKKTKYMTFNLPSTVHLHLTYNKNVIEEVNVFKYLGFWLDREMNWHYHINKMLSSLSAVAGVFYRISPYIPEKIRSCIFHALFNSRIVYEITIWGCSHQQEINKVQRIQNRALKNLYGLPFRTSTCLMHKDLKYLLINQQIKYTSSIHMYKILNGFLHTNTVVNFNHQFHQHSTRNRHKIRVNNLRTTTFGTRSVFYRALSEFNNLSEEAVSLNLNKFKSNLKCISFNNL